MLSNVSDEFYHELSMLEPSFPRSHHKERADSIECTNTPTTSTIKLQIIGRNHKRSTHQKITLLCSYQDNQISERNRAKPVSL